MAIAYHQAQRLLICPKFHKKMGTQVIGLSIGELFFYLVRITVKRVELSRANKPLLNMFLIVLTYFSIHIN